MASNKTFWAIILFTCSILSCHYIYMSVLEQDLAACGRGNQQFDRNSSLSCLHFYRIYFVYPLSLLTRDYL